MYVGNLWPLVVTYGSFVTHVALLGLVQAVLSASDWGARNMATVKKAPLLNGAPPWSIIPLANICQSCMLIPRNVPSDSSWTSNTVLDKASSFLVNNWSSIYSYKTLYK